MRLRWGRSGAGGPGGQPARGCILHTSVRGALARFAGSGEGTTAAVLGRCRPLPGSRCSLEFGAGELLVATISPAQCTDEARRGHPCPSGSMVRGQSSPRPGGGRRTRSLLAGFFRAKTESISTAVPSWADEGVAQHGRLRRSRASAARPRTSSSAMPSDRGGEHPHAASPGARADRPGGPGRIERTSGSCPPRGRSSRPGVALRRAVCKTEPRCPPLPRRGPLPVAEGVLTGADARRRVARRLPDIAGAAVPGIPQPGAWKPLQVVTTLQRRSPLEIIGTPADPA
jgi:hypothetical protein